MACVAAGSWGVSLWLGRRPVRSWSGGLRSRCGPWCRWWRVSRETTLARCGRRWCRLRPGAGATVPSSARGCFPRFMRRGKHP